MEEVIGSIPIRSTNKPNNLDNVKPTGAHLHYAIPAVVSKWNLPFTAIAFPKYDK